MKTFAEYNLSAPRGPDCCVSVINPFAMNPKLHLPAITMRIGIGEDSGFTLVPDASFIKRSAAGFDGMAMPFIPDI